MATFNLSRNTRVFLCQEVDATTGVIPSSGTVTNSGANRTSELNVLEGFSISQASQSATISLNEAGSDPVRGQRSFNTALDPVEWSFSSYLGPNGTTTVELAERVLWNALLSPVGIQLAVGSGATLTSVTRSSSAQVTATFVHSSYNWATNGFNVGDFMNIGSAAAGTTGWHQWCGPAKVVSLSPSASACTTMVVEYLTAPPAAAGTTASPLPTTANFYRSAYFVSQTNATSEAYAEVNTAVSNKNQLMKFGLIVKIDNAIYAVDNCVVESASIDFSLDGIATVTWTGKGSAMRLLPNLTISDASPAVFGGTGGPTGTSAIALAVSHIANKLSTVTLTSNIQGASGTSYTVPITGGNLTIANNATYLTPAALRTVNTPITYFLGTRAISGSLNAYLRTGSGNTAQLLTDIIAQGTEPKFALTIDIGGPTGRRVEVILNGAMLQVPSIETADVVTTTINFNAQGYTPLASSNTYNMEYTNDLVMRCYGQ